MADSSARPNYDTSETGFKKFRLLGLLQTMFGMHYKTCYLMPKNGCGKVESRLPCHISQL